MLDLENGRRQPNSNAVVSPPADEEPELNVNQRDQLECQIKAGFL